MQRFRNSYERRDFTSRAVESLRGSVHHAEPKTLVKNDENIQLLSYYMYTARCTRDITSCARIRSIPRDIFRTCIHEHFNVTFEFFTLPFSLISFFFFFSFFLPYTLSLHFVNAFIPQRSAPSYIVRRNVESLTFNVKNKRYALFCNI